MAEPRCIVPVPRNRPLLVPTCVFRVPLRLRYTLKDMPDNPNHAKTPNNPQKSLCVSGGFCDHAYEEWVRTPPPDTLALNDLAPTLRLKSGCHPRAGACVCVCVRVRERGS